MHIDTKVTSEQKERIKYFFNGLYTNILQDHILILWVYFF